jgi:hypothetical protein
MHVLLLGGGVVLQMRGEEMQQGRVPYCCLPLPLAILALATAM